MQSASFGQDPNVHGLALAVLVADGERNLIAFHDLKVADDVGDVRKIVLIVRRDEAVAALGIEPFHLAGQAGFGLCVHVIIQNYADLFQNSRFGPLQSFTVFGGKHAP
jgi:hypothetical protein